MPAILLNKFIGGWINQFLRNGLAVVNDDCRANREFVLQFAKVTNWEDIKIYEKYISDTVTNDDLPLTMAPEEFQRQVQALYQKSQLYKGIR